MGANQSSGSGSDAGNSRTATEGAGARKCYYELLEVDVKASEDEYVDFTAELALSDYSPP